jgi:hypothetical protein
VPSGQGGGPPGFCVGEGLESGKPAHEPGYRLVGEMGRFVLCGMAQHYLGDMQTWCELTHLER